jgi:hypothetical protein
VTHVPKQKIAHVIRARGWKWIGSLGLSDPTQISIARVQCQYGHKWSISTEKLLAPSCACPRCMGNVSRRERCIHRLRTYIKSRHGECLSDPVSLLTSKGKISQAEIRIRCAKSHEWKTGVRSILARRAWCNACLLETKMEGLRQLAARQGGRCLSESYTNAFLRMKWRCSKGHEWLAKVYAIKAGTWCPQCAGHLKLSIDEMRRTARLRGGECLSTVYVSSNKKLRWRCGSGHEWEAKPNNIRASKTWCPVCSHNAPHTIEKMGEVASKRGGKCLSKIYKNNHTRMVWRCRLDHQWKATPHNVLEGSWCQKCAVMKRSSRAKIRPPVSERALRTQLSKVSK